MIKCLSCGAETSNGLALCELCQRKVRADLEFLPVYFRNLGRWRPGSAGSRSVPGSREPRSTVTAASDRISVAVDEAGNELMTWARALVDDRSELGRIFNRLCRADLNEIEVTRWLCIGFDRYLTSVSTLDWCGEFVAAIGHHEQRLRIFTEQVAPGWYAGGCKHCGSGTYVVPGLTWLTCAACGTTTAARDHLETVLSEARPWVARPKAIAETLVALLDTEPSVPKLHDRIRKWESLGWLTPHRRLDADGDNVGPKRYRLGDVLDLTVGKAAAPTRPKRVTAA